MKTSNLLLRTLLFVPGHNDKLIISADNSDADALVFDLEDSVLPFEVKSDARSNVKNWIEKKVLKHKQIFIRVNDIISGVLLKDLHTLTLDGVTGFLYPKTKNGEDIFFIDRLLETIEYEKGMPIGKFKIIPIIEGAAAVLNGQEICQASKRVVALAFGSADFITDLRGTLDNERESISIPRSLIALAARANSVYPIDTSFNNVHDLEGLEYNLKIAKNLGFEGMSVLHPKQINLAHQYFTPSNEEIENAKNLLRLNELAIQEKRGVAIKDGRFIGPPLIEDSKKILEKFEKVKNKEI